MAGHEDYRPKSPDLNFSDEDDQTRPGPPPPPPPPQQQQQARQHQLHPQQQQQQQQTPATFPQPLRINLPPAQIPQYTNYYHSPHAQPQSYSEHSRSYSYSASAQSPIQPTTFLRSSYHQHDPQSAATPTGYYTDASPTFAPPPYVQPVQQSYQQPFSSPQPFSPAGYPQQYHHQHQQPHPAYSPTPATVYQPSSYAPQQQQQQQPQPPQPPQPPPPPQQEQQHQQHQQQYHHHQQQQQQAYSYGNQHSYGTYNLPPTLDSSSTNLVKLENPPSPDRPPPPPAGTTTMPPRRSTITVAVDPPTVDPSPVKTKFPTARIKRIMQNDEEVGKVAQQTPIAVGKALEMFMIALVSKSAEVARDKSSKRVTPAMLKTVIEADDQWDFLREIASKVEPEREGGASGGKGKGAAALKAEGGSESEMEEEEEEEEEVKPVRRRGGRKKKTPA